METAAFCQDEAAILQRCRRGSREAFEAVVNRYMKDAYRIALGLVGNHEDAMELSQEAFYRAYLNIRLLKGDRQFFPWFYQILRNLCFTHLRRMRLRRTSALPENEGQEFIAAQGDWFDPDAVTERTELKQALWQAMGKLSDKHREVILLRHFQNLSYDQIAKVMFCNKGTVMSRLYHARKQLRELLDKEKGGSWS
ncbi:MAG: sigma-70 family RNA polymerase sigma factor [Sedimentisphaerales bacterium]|nr:sigma-70 family RNA polymerase sigma factor [Sedimentisphaerales bacterium]